MLPASSHSASVGEASWFPELTRLAQQDPLPLPRSRTLLKQPRSGIFHNSPEVLQLHAWMLEKLP